MHRKSESFQHGDYHMLDFKNDEREANFITVGFNYDQSVYNDGGREVYIRIHGGVFGDKEAFAAFSEATAREIRDHLNFLLGDDSPEEVATAPVEDDSVAELAHQLSLIDWVSIDSLTEALNNFNK